MFSLVPLPVPLPPHLTLLITSLLPSTHLPPSGSPTSLLSSAPLIPQHAWGPTVFPLLPIVLCFQPFTCLSLPNHPIPVSSHFISLFMNPISCLTHFLSFSTMVIAWNHSTRRERGYWGARQNEDIWQKSQAGFKPRIWRWKERGLLSQCGTV